MASCGSAQAEGDLRGSYRLGFDFRRAGAEERAALATFGQELVGSGRPRVIAAGTPPVPGRNSAESDPLPTGGPVWRCAHSVMAPLALAPEGVGSSAVRLPRTVHNQGKGGFAVLPSEMARQSGVAGYPLDDHQRWPAVHALDAASLSRVYLERASAATSWHAVADEGDLVRDTVEVIGRRLGVPVQGVASESFAPLGQIFAVHPPASSAHTQETLAGGERT